MVYYLHGDHLNSTTLTTDQSGNIVAEARYLPYGGLRWENGAAVTDFGFTGQRAEAFGLLDYNARYYSPMLGRFVSADTVVPEAGNPQALNRYAYTLGNPLRYNDPSGHQCVEGDMPCWEARWYEAHGYSQVDGNWTFTGNYIFWDTRAFREFALDAGQDNPPIAQWQSDIGAILSTVATSLDYFNFAISATGIGVEALTAMGIEIADPTPGGGTLVGFAGGAVFYNATLNRIENTASAWAALLVIASDLVAENSYYDPDTREFVMGQDTAVSIASLAFGNIPLTPEAITDSGFNFLLMAYDTGRLADKVPTLMEIRIGRRAHRGVPYIRVTAPKPR